MITAQKVLAHCKPACKWEVDFMARPTWSPGLIPNVGEGVGIDRMGLEGEGWKKSV